MPEEHRPAEFVPPAPCSLLAVAAHGTQSDTGDAVIVTGGNTSGCVRATPVDSFNCRYRTIAPEDCVGDIEEQPHRDNLRDIWIGASRLHQALPRLDANGR